MGESIRRSASRLGVYQNDPVVLRLPRGQHCSPITAMLAKNRIREFQALVGDHSHPSNIVPIRCCNNTWLKVDISTVNPALTLTAPESDGVQRCWTKGGSAAKCLSFGLASSISCQNHLPPARLVTRPIVAKGAVAGIQCRFYPLAQLGHVGARGFGMPSQGVQVGA